MTVIDVRLLQSALRQQGFWPRAEPLTCLYDQRTADLLPGAIRKIEERARDSIIGDLFLDAQGIGEGELDEATEVHPNADRSQVTIEPSAVYDRALEQFRSRVTLQPCGPGTTVAQTSSTPRTAPTFEPAPTPPSNFNGDTPDSLCLCVRRLADGLYAMAYLESPEHDGWDNEMAQAWIDACQIHLGFIPPVTGRIGDRYVYAHFSSEGASSHEEALASFRPLQRVITAARNEQGITPPPECCPPREGSFAVAESQDLPEGEGGVVEMQEQAPKKDYGLAIGLGALAFGGSLWWAMKRKGKRR